MILIATGSEVALALAAHEELSADGIRSASSASLAGRCSTGRTRPTATRCCRRRHRPRLDRGGLDPGLGSIRGTRGCHHRDAHLRHLGAARRTSRPSSASPPTGWPRAAKELLYMKPTAKLHELGQSLWLDNITRTMLDDGTLERLHRRPLGHRPDLEPDDLRQGDLPAATPTTSRSPSSHADGRLDGEELFFELAIADLRRAADLFARCTSAPTASTASSRSRSRRCSPTTPRRRSSRRPSCTPRPARDNLFIKIPGTAEGLPAIEESIFAGIPINVTLLFSTRAVPRRGRRLHARDRAADRGRASTPTSPRSPRSSSAAGTSPSRERSVPDELRNRLGIAIGGRAYARLPRAARLRPLAAAR